MDDMVNSQGRRKRHDGRDDWHLEARAEGEGTLGFGQGDLVLLTFVRDRADDQGRTEELWVRVLGEGDGGWHGELDNQPTWIRGLSSDDPVSFEGRHVYQVMRDYR